MTIKTCTTPNAAAAICAPTSDYCFLLLLLTSVQAAQIFFVFVDQLFHKYAALPHLTVQEVFAQHHALRLIQLMIPAQLIQIIVNFSLLITSNLGNANSSCVCGSKGTSPCSGTTPKCVSGICVSGIQACLAANITDKSCLPFGDFCKL